MKKPFPHVILGSMLCFFSVTQSVLAAERPENIQPSSIIADVNGHKLTIAEFQAYIRLRMSKEKQPGNLDENQRKRIFDEYINRELLYQEAIKNNVDKNAIVNAEIENQRRNIVVSYALQHLMKKPPLESDMMALYEKELAIPGKEYKTRHILVKTEEQAKQLIKELDKGKNFMQLAMQYSIDASAKKGGELGWFSERQMVEPYTAATQKLTNGSYTHTPVETRFGWHIIRLDGTRKVPAPSFEEVKDQLKAQINNRRISVYIANLRENATVTLATIPTDNNSQATAAAVKK